MAKRSRLFTATVAALLLPLAGEAAQVYPSAANDGSPDGSCIPIDAAPTGVNLFISHGQLDTMPVEAKCDGTGGEVEGEEVCMYDLVLETGPDVYIESFVPEPGSEISASVEANRVRIIGGDPVLGQLGATRIGTLNLSADGPGELSLTEGRFLDTRLEVQAIPASYGLAYAEYDGDGDRICDGIDVCPDTYNRRPVLDSNGDGVPNDCQCGDPNGSGAHESEDLFLVYRCLGNDPTLVEECSQMAIQGDANGSSSFESDDLFQIFRVLTNEQHPAELTCPARMDGFIP